MDEFSNLAVAVGDDGVALLTIDREEVRNCLDRHTVDECHQALSLLADRRDVRVLIITGAGEKAFVSGADIRQLAKRDKHQALAGINQRLFQAIEDFPRPVIAAVNGFALGGGCELSLACDIRVASENARFGFPETGLGIMPAAGGTQRLPRLVGWGKARELILTGEIIDAAEALRIGLVHRVVPLTELMSTARDYAAKVLTRGPLAVRLAKQALNLSQRTGLDTGLHFESAAQAILFESNDKHEGMTAFLERRPPTFTGS